MDPDSHKQHGVHILGLNCYMMTSSNGNIFRVSGPLWGESIGPRLIPLTKASDTELWRFFWSDQTVEQTIKTPVTSDAIALIMTLPLWEVAIVGDVETTPEVAPLKFK